MQECDLHEAPAMILLFLLITTSSAKQKCSKPLETLFASQSSTYVYNRFALEAKYAIDSSIETGSHTATHTPANFTAVFTKPTCALRLEVYNGKNDGYAKQLNGADVYVSDSPNSGGVVITCTIIHI